MLGQLLKPEIEDMMRSGDFDSIRSALMDLPPGEIADALKDLSPDNFAAIFRILPRVVATEAFEYLEADDQETVLRALGDAETAIILNTMSPDERTHMLEEMPAKATRRLLALLSPGELAIARRLLGYPEESIGRLMNPNYVAVQWDWTVDEALAHARVEASRSETLEILYVIKPSGYLMGEVRIGDLLMAANSAALSTIIDYHLTPLTTTEDQEKALVAFRNDRRHSLPVVDPDGILVGIVTSDDILDVAEAAATEDIQKLGGTEALDKPYLSIALSAMIKKRAGWLVVLFIGEMLTATAMTQF